MTKHATKPKPPRRVMLQGWSQIRAFFKELGFSPPPHKTTIRRWAHVHGCPVRSTLERRVIADAAELGRWIRQSYIGEKLGKPTQE